jgi:hypothetical protein
MDRDILAVADADSLSIDRAEVDCGEEILGRRRASVDLMT